MTGAAILSSLGGIPSGPAGFRTFRLERISETLGAFVLILTTLTWLESSSTEKVRTDSLIVM